MVKQKGLETFRECSQKRNDDKLKIFLINRLSITVHDTCRKHYTNKKLFTAAMAAKQRRDFDIVVIIA